MDLLNEGDKPSQQPQQPARTAGSPAPVTDTATRVEALIAALRAAGVDITADYNDWLKVGFALAGEFGEGGRGYFHDISSLYPGYDQAESDTKYTECLKSDSGRTDISTLFYLAKNQGVTLERPANAAGTTQVAPRTKGQSDKNVPLSLSEDDPEEMPILPLFPASIYPNLPGLLKDVTDLMHTDQEKSLVLIGSIVTLSSAMVPVMTIYFGKTIYPNMYLFVPGPAGAGKGKLDFCFRLVKPIHKEKLDRWNTAKDEYKKEYARYKRQKKGENIDPPEKPPIQLLRVPANSSSTSFQQAMAENGNLLMFETEGDTVVNAFSSDYGDYSDAFRKAFAHESFGYLRRGDDGEEREIDNPRLATVLSGTHCGTKATGTGSMTSAFPAPPTSSCPSTAPSSSSTAASGTATGVAPSTPFPRPTNSSGVRKWPATSPATNSTPSASTPSPGPSSPSGNANSARIQMPPSPA